MRIGFVYPEFNRENLNGWTVAIPHILAVLREIGEVDQFACSARPAHDTSNRLNLWSQHGWLPPYPRKLELVPRSRLDTLDLVVGFSGSVSHILRPASCPKYVIVQDSLTSLSRMNPRIPAILRSPISNWYACYERKFYKNLDGVQVVSKSEADVIRNLDSRVRIDINPNAVEPREYANRQTMYTKQFLTVGVLGDFRATRNVRIAQFAANALQKVRIQSGEDHRLKIIGWGANYLAGSSWVTCRDNVPDVDSELEDVSLLISVDQHATGIKTSVLRALATGIPCIVSSRVARPILEASNSSAANSGLVITEHDVSQCAHQILELIRDRHRLKVLSRAAHAYSRNFTWALYRDCVKSNLLQLIKS